MKLDWNAFFLHLSTLKSYFKGILDILTVLGSMSTTIRISTFLAVFAIFFGQSMSCDSALPSGKDWANDWDLPMNFECENGEQKLFLRILVISRPCLLAYNFLQNGDVRLKPVFGLFIHLVLFQTEELKFILMSLHTYAGNAITSLYSFWLGCKNDRVWSLECGAVGKFNNEKKCSLTAEVNEWDGPLFKMCDGNGYVGGLSSVHDNGKEDRR